MKKHIIAFVVLALIVVGCAETQVSTDPNTGQSITNVVPNHYVVQGASTINVVAPLLPAPWNGVVLAISSLVTIIAGIFARVKQAQLQDHATMLKTVVAGVEQGNNNATKQAIHALATVAGVNEKLDPIVQQISDILPKKTS